VLDAYLTTRRLAGGLDDPQTELPSRVLAIVMLMVLALAAVNAIFITWATVLDNRHASALTRALGATPGDVSAALAGAHVLPALAGAIVGAFPGGIALFAAIIAITGGDRDRATLPPLWQLIALVVGTVLVVTALTAGPARLGARRPAAPALRAERP
jgi:putative ABC transport system permease protein